MDFNRSIISKVFNRNLPIGSETAKAMNDEKLNDPKGFAFVAAIDGVLGKQQGLRKPSEISFQFLRKLSNILPMAGICKLTLKNWVSQTDWTLQPISKVVPNSKHFDEIYKLLNKPNRNNETFRTLMSGVCEDLLDCDAGILEKVRNGYGKVAELWNRDPETIRPLFDDHGVVLDPAYAQFIEDFSNPDATWSNDDMIYMMQNPQKSFAKFGYGLSPLEIVIFSANTLLMAEQFNSTFFSSSSIPPSIINLGPNIQKDQIESFRASWIAMLYGADSKWRTPIISADSNFKIEKLRESNQDMQFMEFTMWLSRIVVAAYGLSPQDIGLTMDVNKATGEVQAQISKSKGYKSLLTVIREYINSEIISDFGYEEEFTFEWLGIDNIDQQIQSDIDASYVQSGIMSGNEVRVKLGLDPIKGLEKPMVMTKSGPVWFDATPLQDLDVLELEQIRISEESNANVNADRQLNPEQNNVNPEPIPTQSNSPEQSDEQNIQPQKSVIKKKRFLKI